MNEDPIAADARAAVPDYGTFRPDPHGWLTRLAATMPDAADVWDDGLPPGGQVCGECGQPTESEPCADHQPRAVAQYEAKALRMDLEALRVTLPVIAGEYTTRVSVSMLRRMYNALTSLDPIDTPASAGTSDEA